jgi:hypothetical protein
MTPHIEPIAVRMVMPTHSICEQGEWVERCRARIFEKEPLLAPDDAFDLASDLWDRPDCQKVTPELAAGLLFSDQLRCLSCPLRGDEDFSVLCVKVQTVRCPTSRAVLNS